MAKLALSRVRRPTTRTARATAPRPFTVAHFLAWSRQLILDNGRRWKLEPFQLAFVEDLFSGRPENWLVCPEGQGKTTLVAGIALYHLQHRASAYVPIAASSRDQARALYRQAEGFVLRSRAIRSTFECLPGYRQVRLAKREDSMIQVFAADDRTGDGVVPSLCVLDELHRHKDLSLYELWRGKLGKRGAQLIAISTAGEPGSPFEQVRAWIRETVPAVERRETFTRAVNEQIVFHDWAVPEKGDVEDLELVKRANPFSGITLADLRKKRHSPTVSLAHWSRFTCNRATRGVNAAITEAEWFGAATSERIPEGAPIWLGLDVGWKWDSTAMVPLWIRDPAFRLLGPATILTPPRDGSSLDPHAIEAALLDVHRRNPIHTCVMDETRAEQMAVWIRDTLGATVIARPQTDAFATQDYERFMEALRSGWLKHSGDAGLTRHAMNAVARMLPAGRTRFDRPSQTRQGGDQEARVVDGLSAAAMVHAQYATPAPPQPLQRWVVLG